MLVAIGFSIRAVSERTGLSQHTIRAWERRYGVLNPSRTDTNRRVYEEGDVLRLELLARLVEAGHSIGMIAGLPDDELRRLKEGVFSSGGASAGSLLGSCLKAVSELNEEALATELRRAASTLGTEKYLDEIVSPLLRHVGNEWERDDMGIAREHLVSAVLRGQLEELRRVFTVGSGAPRIIVTTPAGELHEFGAMMAALAAAREGWRVYYLGPNLPADEIAMAAHRVGAAAVALSVVHPASQAAVIDNLSRLAAALSGRTLLIGGSAGNWLQPTIDRVGATYLESLGELKFELARIRSSAPSRN